MKNKNIYIISIAIVISGLLIAGAIIMSNSYQPSEKKDDQIEKNNKVVNKSPSIKNIKPVTENDHILGNPSASIKIVEFSDTECPFCQRFHPTMQRIIDEYGKSGKVAWVYRHFPLDGLHKKARKEAEATECAAEAGGNKKFWEYVNRLFEITPANDGLDLNKLPEIAEHVGINRKKFLECLNSGKYAEEVEKDVQDAIASGGRGTPYSVVVVDGEAVSVINGAEPYNLIKQKIEIMLK